MARGKAEQDKRREFLSSMGLRSEDVVAWVQKWHTLQYHCKQNGKVNELTFYDYVHLALQAGIRDTKMIGRDIDSYQLGRYGDTGGYTLNNCRFITKKQNLDERIESGAIARAVESNRKNTLALRKHVVVTTPEGVEYVFHGLQEAANFLSSWASNVSVGARTGKKVRGHTITYRE